MIMRIWIDIQIEKIHACAYNAVVKHLIRAFDVGAFVKKLGYLVRITLFRGIEQLSEIYRRSTRNERIKV